MSNYPDKKKNARSNMEFSFNIICFVISKSSFHLKYMLNSYSKVSIKFYSAITVVCIKLSMYNVYLLSMLCPIIN